MVRTSKIWTIDKFDLEVLVNKANSLSDLLREIGLTPEGSGNHHRLKMRLLTDGIDFSHIKLGLDNNRGRRFRRDYIPLEEILVENSTYTNRASLKTRLIAAGLLKNECYECGLSTWKEKPISLHLDHINGVFNDNRIDNLRMMCPNCHSQSETYAGKNKKYKDTSDVTVA